MARPPRRLRPWEAGSKLCGLVFGCYSCNSQLSAYRQYAAVNLPEEMCPLRSLGLTRIYHFASDYSGNSELKKGGSMLIVLRIALASLYLFAIPNVAAQTPTKCKDLVHEPLSVFWRCKGNEEKAHEAECHEANGRFSAAYWRCVGNDKKAQEAETEAHLLQLNDSVDKAIESEQYEKGLLYQSAWRMTRL